jgi:hypothetical protein
MNITNVKLGQIGDPNSRGKRLVTICAKLDKPDEFMTITVSALNHPDQPTGSEKLALHEQRRDLAQAGSAQVIGWVREKILRFRRGNVPSQKSLTREPHHGFEAGGVPTMRCGL